MKWLIYFLPAHPCEYPRIPLNGNRTCYEDEEGVVCQFFCLDGYTFAIEPATQYTCAFDNKWEPADMLPVSDCTGTVIVLSTVKFLKFCTPAS